MFHQILTWVGYIFLADFLPILRPVTRLLSNEERRMAKTAKRADAFLEYILQEHRQKLNTKEASEDFVDMMLTSQDEDGKYLDDNTIKVLTLVNPLSPTSAPTISKTQNPGVITLYLCDSTQFSAISERLFAQEPNPSKP